MLGSDCAGSNIRANNEAVGAGRCSAAAQVGLMLLGYGASATLGNGLRAADLRTV